MGELYNVFTTNKFSSRQWRFEFIMIHDSFHCLITIQLEKMSAQFTVDKKEMEERHTLVQKMVSKKKMRQYKSNLEDIVNYRYPKMHNI